MRFIRKYILLFCLAAPMWAAGQFTSFETNVKEWSGRYVTTIETHDSCFLFMTIHSLFKINHRGKVLWKFESYNANRSPYSDNILIDDLPVFFNHVFTDEKGIYIYAHRLNGFSSCLLKLDHNGNLLRDTFYYNTWLYSKPFESVGNMIDRGTYYFSVGKYYHGLKFNADSTQSSADKTCTVSFKLDKATGTIYDEKYHCFLDSNHSVFYVAPLNTQDKGYLYVIYAYPKPPEPFETSKAHYLIAQADSNGNVLSVKDMFPPDKFEGFSLAPDRFSIEEFFHSNDLYVSIPRHMKNRIPFGTHAIAVVTFKPSGPVMKRGTHYIYYDSSGNIFKIEPLNLNPIPNSYVFNLELHTQILEEYIMSYYDFANELKWSLKYQRESSIGLEVGARLTNSNGCLLVYMKDYNEPYEFTIRHINNQGWEIGYDPYAWTEDKPIHTWFNAQGQLVVPDAMQHWQIKISDMTGRVLHTTTPPDNGLITLPITIPPGVYIVHFVHPHTGEVRHKKVFRE